MSINNNINSINNNQSSRMLHIILSGLDFSKRIRSRHMFSQKTNRFPILILLRAAASKRRNRIINISHSESFSCSFNPYFIFKISLSPHLYKNLQFYRRMHRRCYPVTYIVNKPVSRENGLSYTAQYTERVSHPEYPGSVKKPIHDHLAKIDTAIQRILQEKYQPWADKSIHRTGLNNYKTVYFDPGGSVSYTSPEANLYIFNKNLSYNKNLKKERLQTVGLNFSYKNLERPLLISLSRIISKTNAAIKRNNILPGTITSGYMSSAINRASGIRLNAYRAVEPASGSEKGISSRPVSPVPDSGMHEPHTYQKRTAPSFRASIHDVGISHTELIHRKKFSELIHRKQFSSIDRIIKHDSVNAYKENIISSNISSNIYDAVIQNNQAEYNFKDKDRSRDEEANIIADRVYKIIEKRIAIEKDRRGMI